MKYLKRIVTSISSITLLIVFVTTAYAIDTTVTVTGNTSAGENQPGWLFNRDVTTATPFTFNTDQQSIGTGSLYVMPIGANTSDKFVGENFINTPIADINSIKYDFRIGSGGVATEEEQFYMNVYANFGTSDDLKFYDCRYNVVPSVGSTAAFTTVTFDPTLAYPVTTRTGAPGTASPFTCPAIPADMDNFSDGSNMRMFSLNVGDTSSSDEGLDGYLDKVIVDVNTDVTTYDFEPATPAMPVPTACTGMTFSGDPIMGTEGSEKINGTNGNDLIFALGGSDKVDGKGGHDCIVGGAGSDKLIGGTGDDVILGGTESDSLDGNNGTDKLYGDEGSDSLKGGNGNDQLFGGAGSDSLKGDDDNDTLTGDEGSDSAKGGSGTDTCTAESSKQCE